MTIKRSAVKHSTVALLALFLAAVPSRATDIYLVVDLSYQSCQNPTGNLATLYERW